MRIAIYGDSFAADNVGWPQYIEKHYGASIDNYAVGGTSIKYSYSRFRDTYKNYDKVIVFWSSHDRTSLILKKHKESFVHFGECNYGNSKSALIRYNEGKFPNWEDEKLSEKDKKKLLWLWLSNQLSLYKKTYDYGNIHDLEHNAMRDSVLYRRPDAHIVECFGEFGLVNVQNADFINNVGDIDEWWKVYKESHHMRKNHMTPIQNEEFAGYLIKHMEDPTFDVHTTFNKETIQDYYTMSKNYFEAGFNLIKNK